MCDELREIPVHHGSSCALQGLAAAMQIIQEFHPKNAMCVIKNQRNAMHAGRQACMYVCICDHCRCISLVLNINPFELNTQRTTHLVLDPFIIIATFQNIRQAKIVKLKYVQASQILIDFSHLATLLRHQ